MTEWINNGCQLGWLIDPEAEVVYVYSQSSDFQEAKGFDQKLSGEPVLKGFALDLSELRIP